nr:DUF4012 domain-containing protein [Nocardioides panaciterrulae]
MIGADGPRDYLLIFQNNAEIRATGGLPGSWSVIHAEDGKLKVTQQGSLQQFPPLPRPVLPLSKAELAVHGEQLGTFFADANFTPDFPRAAQLWTARFEQEFPATHLDGVLSLDPVALSYLLKGTGPVTVAGRTITSENAVDELLSRPYRELEPAQQDVLFAHAAKAIFDATTGHLKSPLGFVRGLSRAASEGRFLVSVDDPEVSSQLAGTRVESALTGDDGRTPHVDIALNDATGTKMSYYLRYSTDLESTSCQDQAQRIQASMTLNQKITPEAARKLPASVTGPGTFGTGRGKQLVVIDIYAPHGGTFDSLSINGKSLTDSLNVTHLNGRPVTQVPIMLSSTKDVVINWTMTTGPGETGDIHLGMTPSIVPGDNNAVIHSAC